MWRFSEKEKRGAPGRRVEEKDSSKEMGSRGEGGLESCERGRTRFPVLNSRRERERGAV